MKTSIKTLHDVSTLHDLRTYTGAIRKSGKPALPTTAILDLYMRRSERDRIVRELKTLKRRKRQMRKRLEDVEKEMIKLFKKAAKTAKDMRGDSSKEEKKRSILKY